MESNAQTNYKTLESVIEKAKNKKRKDRLLCSSTLFVLFFTMGESLTLEHIWWLLTIMARLKLTGTKKGMSELQVTSSPWIEWAIPTFILLMMQSNSTLRLMAGFNKAIN